MPETLHAVERDTDLKVENLADEALLARYYSEHDEACFAELVRRHQHSAYRVAFARCGNQDLAEEAAQEAFLQLSLATSGPPHGIKVSFRFWFFGVVSNIALNAMRSERRSSRRARSPRHREDAMSKQPGPSPETVALEKDQREVLVMALGNLGEEQRLPIILHFMEGLTQDQIGQIVGVTQSVIARRIASGLEALRSRLAQVGIGITAVALPELLKSDALLRLPQPLQLVPTSSLPSHGASRSASRGTSSRTLRKVSRAHASKGVPVAAIMALIMIAVALAIWANLPSERAPATAVTPIPRVTGERAPNAFNYSWDLRKSPAGSDLKLVEGTWSWRKGEGMATPIDSRTLLLLPIKITAHPVEIELTLSELNVQRYFGGVFFSDGQGIPAMTVWSGHLEMAEGVDPVMRVILTEHETINSTNGKVFSMEVYNSPLKDPMVCVAIRNTLIRKITVRTLGPEAMKAATEDSLAFRREHGAGELREAYVFKP